MAVRVGPYKFHMSRVSHNGASQPQDSTPNVTTGEVGVTGSYTSYGYPLPEYNTELRGIQGARIYDQMRRSDAQIRGSLRIVKAPIVSGNWYMEPASDSDLDKEVAQFVDWNLLQNTMQNAWKKFLSEALSYLDFGYYSFEKVFEEAVWRPEKASDNAKPRQKTVAKIHSLSPRHPVTINRPLFDGKGNLSALEQIVFGQLKPIPRDKLLIFTLDEEAGDPRGISLLRSVYMHWFYKMNLYKIDGIQKERHGIGIPRVKLPVGFTKDDKTEARKWAKDLRSNEKAFAVQPPLWDFDFIEPKGQMVDVLASAEHHGLMILQNVLAQFLALGTQESGSRAVSSGQIDVFQRSLRYLADIIASEINQRLIPELVDYNYQVDSYPELRVRRIGENVDWRTFSVALRNLIEPGAVTPDPDLEKWLRDQMELPIPPKDVMTRGVFDRVKRITERLAGPAPSTPEEKIAQGAIVKPGEQSGAVPAGVNPSTGARKGSQSGKPVG